MGLLYKSEFALLENGAKKLNVPFDAVSENEIKLFINKHHNLRAYVFELPEKAGKLDAGLFAQLVKNAAASIGLGIQLASKKILVLFPYNVDCELISRHFFLYYNISETAFFDFAGIDMLKERLKVL